VQHPPAQRPEQPLAEEQDDSDGQEERDEQERSDRDARPGRDDLELAADLGRLGLREVDVRPGQAEQRVLRGARLALEAEWWRLRRRGARGVGNGLVGIQRRSSVEGLGDRAMPWRSYQRGPCDRTPCNAVGLAAA
jgi:hypothetical protein